MAARPAVLIVIRRLVPLVLRGDEEVRAGVASKQRLVTHIVIRAVFGGARALRSGGLAVVQPIGKPDRVPERDKVHRTVGPVGGHAVAEVGG